MAINKGVETGFKPFFFSGSLSCSQRYTFEADFDMLLLPYHAHLMVSFEEINRNARPYNNQL